MCLDKFRATLSNNCFAFTSYCLKHYYCSNQLGGSTKRDLRVMLYYFPALRWMVVGWGRLGCTALEAIVAFTFPREGSIEHYGVGDLALFLIRGLSTVNCCFCSSFAVTSCCRERGKSSCYLYMLYKYPWGVFGPSSGCRLSLKPRHTPYVSNVCC